MNPLLPILQDIIRTEGPISIERYMQLVLHHPAHGYYRHRDPLGAGGDFITAPEVSQMFGETVGAWCVQTWQALG
jgi:SAM-dependent MidA family methyltransferase